MTLLINGGVSASTHPLQIANFMANIAKNDSTYFAYKIKCVLVEKPCCVFPQVSILVTDCVMVPNYRDICGGPCDAHTLIKLDN